MTSRKISVSEADSFCLLKFVDKYFEGFFPSLMFLLLVSTKVLIQKLLRHLTNKNQSKFKKKVLFPVFHLFLKNQIPGAISA